MIDDSRCEPSGFILTVEKPTKTPKTIATNSILTVSNSRTVVDFFCYILQTCRTFQRNTSNIFHQDILKKFQFKISSKINFVFLNFQPKKIIYLNVVYILKIVICYLLSRRSSVIKTNILLFVFFLKLSTFSFEILQL